MLSQLVEMFAARQKGDMKKSELKNGTGWAWSFGSGICSWAVASKKVLLAEHKPSPKSIPLMVALVPIGKIRAANTSTNNGRASLKQRPTWLSSQCRNVRCNFWRKAKK